MNDTFKKDLMLNAKDPIPSSISMTGRTVKQNLGNRDSDEESSILMDVDGQDRYNWKPRHVIAQWENGDGVKHITVLLALV